MRLPEQIQKHFHTTGLVLVNQQFWLIQLNRNLISHLHFNNILLITVREVATPTTLVWRPEQYLVTPNHRCNETLHWLHQRQIQVLGIGKMSGAVHIIDFD